MRIIKRLLSVCLAIFMLLALTVSAFCVTLEDEELAPGSLHTMRPSYKMSWINKLVVRDDALAIATAKLVPHADYPYDVTYEQFLKDIENCMTVYGMDEDTVTVTYQQVVDLLYYSAVAMEMTDDPQTMYKKLAKEGIRVPVEMTAEEKIEAAVVYADLKYNLTYALFKKKPEFTKGRTIEGATVDILATALDSTLPSGVDSINGLALYGCKAYCESFEGLPMSDNPDAEEIFYLMKTLISSKNEYPVPTESYDKLTDVQKQYVDCTYYASVLDTMYDIQINALELAKVAGQNDVEAIGRLVLETKLDEAGIEYDKSRSVENLFTLACENGLFPMDEEFYTDVFDYDVYVSEKAEKLWFTPFGLADQLGGDNKFLSVNLNGQQMMINGTKATPLDTSKKTEKITLVVTYEDDTGYSDETTYTFKVIKQKDAEVQSGTGIVGEIESQLHKVIPEDNEKANAVVGAVVTKADELVSEAEQIANIQTTAGSTSNEDTTATEHSTATTFAVDEETTYAIETEPDTDIDFGYLAELVESTFGDDETTYDYSLVTEQTTEVATGVIAQAVEVVKENPEFVVAPTSVIGAGALAGYLFARRKKTPVSEIEEEISEDIDEYFE